jgi:hypothetical protein
LGDFNEGIKINDITTSLKPAKGNFDDFDFSLSLDRAKYLGIESDALKLEG